MKGFKESFYFSDNITNESDEKPIPLDLSLNSTFTSEKFSQLNNKAFFQSNSLRSYEEDDDDEEDDDEEEDEDVNSFSNIHTRKLPQQSASDVLCLGTNIIEENENYNMANSSIDESVEMNTKNNLHSSLFDEKYVRTSEAFITDESNFNNHNTVDVSQKKSEPFNNTYKKSLDLLVKPSNTFKLPPIISPYSNFDSPEAEKNLENIEKDLVGDCTKLEILCYQQKNSFDQMFCCHNHIFQLCVKLSSSCKLLEQACQKLKKNFIDDSPESLKFLKSTECLESSCRQLELACRELKGSCRRVTSSNIDFSDSCNENQIDFKDIKENLARKSAIMKGLEVEPSESLQQRLSVDHPDPPPSLSEVNVNNMMKKMSKQNKVESKNNHDNSEKNLPKKSKNIEKLKNESKNCEEVVRILDFENIFSNENLQLNQTEKCQILKAFAVFSKHCSEFIGKTDPALCKTEMWECCGNSEEGSIKVCDMDNINDKLQEQRKEIRERISQIEETQALQVQKVVEKKVVETKKPVSSSQNTLKGSTKEKNQVESNKNNFKEKVEVKKQQSTETKERKNEPNLNCENNDLKEKTNALQNEFTAKNGLFQGGKKHVDEDSCLNCKTLIDLCAVCMALQEQQMILCRKVTDMEKRSNARREANSSKTMKTSKLACSRRCNNYCNNRNANNNLGSLMTNLWDKNSAEKTTKFPDIHNNNNIVKSNLRYVKRYKSLKETKRNSNSNSSFNTCSVDNLNTNNNNKNNGNSFRKIDEKAKSFHRSRSPREKSPNELLDERQFYKNFFQEFQTIQQQQVKLCAMLNNMQKYLEETPKQKEDMNSREIINTLANRFHSLNFNLNQNTSKEKLSSIDFNNNSKSTSTQTVSDNEMKGSQKEIINENISSKQTKSDEKYFVASQEMPMLPKSEVYTSGRHKSAQKSDIQQTTAISTELTAENKIMSINNESDIKTEKPHILKNLSKDSIIEYQKLNKKYFQGETPETYDLNKQTSTQIYDQQVKTGVIPIEKIVTNVTQDMVLNGEIKQNLNKAAASQCKKICFDCDMFDSCPDLAERLEKALKTICGTNAELNEEATETRKKERKRTDEFGNVKEKESQRERKRTDEFGNVKEKESQRERKRTDEFGNVKEKESQRERKRTDEFGNVKEKESQRERKRTDEFGNVIAKESKEERKRTDEFGNVIEKESQREKKRTDEFGNVIERESKKKRKKTDEFGNVIEENRKLTDEHGNVIDDGSKESQGRDDGGDINGSKASQFPISDSLECVRNLADKNCALKLERMKDFYKSLIIGLGVYETNLYAADAQKKTLSYYGADNLMDYGRFQVPNMSQPWDIAIIKNFLFVADCFTYSVIHRIDLKNNCLMKWGCHSTGVRKLSRTKDDTLLVTKFPNKLVEYNLDGVILKEIIVKADGLEAEHALKINKKTYVVCGRNWLNPCKRIVAVDERGKIKKCFVQTPKFFKNCSSSTPHLYINSWDILNKRSVDQCNNSNRIRNNQQNRDQFTDDLQKYSQYSDASSVEDNFNINANSEYEHLCKPKHPKKPDEHPYKQINLQCYNPSLITQSNRTFHQSVCFDDKTPCLDCKTIVEPVYMAMDRFGNILVCDYASNSIFLLDSNINFIKILLGAGSAYDGSGKCCDIPTEVLNNQKCQDMKNFNIANNKSQNVTRNIGLSENSLHKGIENSTTPAKRISQNNTLKSNNLKKISKPTFNKAKTIKQTPKSEEQILLENLKNSLTMKEFTENIKKYDRMLNKSNNGNSDVGNIKCEEEHLNTTIYGEPLHDCYVKPFLFIPSKNYYLKVANANGDQDTQRIEKPYRICLDEKRQKIYICCCSLYDCNQIQTYQYF